MKSGLLNNTLHLLEKWRTELLILLLTGLSLSILVKSGYYWDDAVNSTLYLYEKYDELSLLQNVLIFMRKYLELGRINVLSIYYYFWFYIENVALYKTLIIFSILADQLVLRLTLVRLGVPKKYGQLAMFLIPMLIQLRAYQDPVSGFYGLMQVITLELLLTVFFLTGYLRNGRKCDLWLSLIPFGIGLMTYEVCFPFILMIFVLIWLYRSSFVKALRDICPFVLMEVVMLGAIFIVRLLYTAESTYAGVAFSLNIPNILNAALCQITAALPLSFYTARHELAIMGTSYTASDVMNYAPRTILRAVSIWDWALIGLSLWLMWLIFRQPSQKVANKAFSALGLTGVCFWLLPVVTVALSERYQGQLFAGLGYLPVYIQYFGVALLLCCALRVCCCLLHGWFKHTVRLLCCVAFCLILLLNLQNDREVTRLMNRDFYNPRLAGEAALRGGLLDFLPADSELLSANPDKYIWEADWGSQGLYNEFYKIYSGRDVNAFGIYDLVGRLMDTGLASAEKLGADGTLLYRPEQELYIIAYDGGTEAGLAKLGRIRELHIDPYARKILQARTDMNLYFVSGKYAAYEEVMLQGSDGETRCIAPWDGQRVRRNAQGVLYQLDEEIDFNSLTILR